MKNEEFKEIGVIENLYKPDTGKELFILLFEGKEEQYSGFGTIPTNLNEAYTKHQKVEITYTKKQGDNRIFRNIVEGKSKILTDEKPKEDVKAKVKTNEIAYIVTGRVTGKLTQEQLKEYEQRCLTYAEKLAETINHKFSVEKSPMKDAIFEKMLTPFVYWIKEELYIEQTNKKLNE